MIDKLIDEYKKAIHSKCENVVKILLYTSVLIFYILFLSFLLQITNFYIMLIPLFLSLLFLGVWTYIAKKYKNVALDQVFEKCGLSIYNKELISNLKEYLSDIKSRKAYSSTFSALLLGCIPILLSVFSFKFQISNRQDIIMLSTSDNGSTNISIIVLFLAVVSIIFTVFRFINGIDELVDSNRKIVCTRLYNDLCLFYIDQQAKPKKTYLEKCRRCYIKKTNNGKGFVIVVKKTSTKHHIWHYKRRRRF